MLIVCFQIAFTLFTALLLGYTVLTWDDVSVCFQRELILLNFVVIYYRIFRLGINSGLFDLFQFSVTAWVVEILNHNDTMNDPTCMDNSYGVVIYCLDLLYKILLVAYTFSAGSFTLFCLGVVLYLLLERFWLGRPLRLFNRRPKLKITDLEKVHFDLRNSTGNRAQLECSICLMEFLDQEEIIKTPLCNHFFHEPCLKVWIEQHNNCPNCRADLRDDLQRLKEGRGQDLQANVQVNNVPQ